MGLGNLRAASENLNQIEECYESNPDEANELIGEIRGILKALLKGLKGVQKPDIPIQETLKKEIEMYKDKSRSEFGARLMGRSEPVGQLAFAFCDALRESFGDERSKQKVENCLFCLRMALARLIDATQREAVETSRRAVPPRVSSTAGVTNAFHPDMVFGKKKYPRAV